MQETAAILIHPDGMSLPSERFIEELAAGLTQVTGQQDSRSLRKHWQADIAHKETTASRFGGLLVSKIAGFSSGDSQIQLAMAGLLPVVLTSPVLGFIGSPPRGLQLSSMWRNRVHFVQLVLYFLAIIFIR